MLEQNMVYRDLVGSDLRKVSSHFTFCTIEKALICFDFTIVKLFQS